MIYSKEEKIKIAFLQLGGKYQLPRDIVFYLYNYLRNIKKHENEEIIGKYKNDLFENLCIKEEFCPENRGLEWAIRTQDNYTRYCLCMNIRIIGMDNYLFKMEDNGFIKAPIKDKVKYLNTSCRDEIIEDYNNFLEWIGTEHENRWRLIIDEYGDSRIL